MRKMYLKISIPLYGCWVGSFTSMSIITIEMNLNELIQKQEQSREIHDYNNEMTDNSIIFMIIRGKWKWSFLFTNYYSMIIFFFSFIIISICLFDFQWILWRLSHIYSRIQNLVFASLFSYYSRLSFIIHMSRHKHLWNLQTIYWLFVWFLSYK